MPKRVIKHFVGKQPTYPIKDPKVIKRIFDYLVKEIEHSKSPIKEYQAYRNYMIILIGFNTAFRAEDLLQLRVCDVSKGYVSIKENKTGKMQNFKMNKNLFDEIKKYIEKYQLKEHDYLFMGQKTITTYKGVTSDVIYPITKENCRLTVIRKIKKSCGIQTKFGLHSLRKTFGYQYMLNGGNILTLMKMYNHSDAATTMLYILWDNEDIEKTRESIFLGQK